MTPTRTVLTHCAVETCSAPAEYELYGRLYPSPGFYCHRHAKRQIHCTCSTCEKQSAWRKVDRNA